jgi:hypothetical protein
MRTNYRVWLEDSVEEEGGYWWYCYLDSENCLQDEIFFDETPDKLQWYIDNKYRIEKV